METMLAHNLGLVGQYLKQSEFAKFHQAYTSNTALSERWKDDIGLNLGMERLEDVEDSDIWNGGALVRWSLRNGVCVRKTECNTGHLFKVFTSKESLRWAISAGLNIFDWDLVLPGIPFGKKKNGDMHCLSFQQACRDGELDIVQAMIHTTNQADLTEHSPQDGSSPLHLAAQKGHTSVVKFLLSEGATIDSLDNAAWTPLHWAAVMGHLDTVITLNESGADKKIKSSNGWTPLEMCKKSGYREVVRYLLNAELLK